MTSNTAETEDILKAIREMMGEESAQETLPKDVLDLTEKVETDDHGLKNQADSVDNGILELTNIIDDNQNPPAGNKKAVSGNVAFKLAI